MSYMNGYKFEIAYPNDYVASYSVTVSRMSDSWKDNEDKPMELTTYMGLFIDGHGFTGMTIYDWDGPKEKRGWMVRDVPVSTDTWFNRVNKWFGEEKTFELIEDILGNRKWESGFTKYYQANRPL